MSVQTNEAEYAIPASITKESENNRDFYSVNYLILPDRTRADIEYRSGNDINTEEYLTVYDENENEYDCKLLNLHCESDLIQEYSNIKPFFVIILILKIIPYTVVISFLLFPNHYD